MSSKGHLETQVMEKITSLLEGLEFGMVQIIVHDSKITQIDRLEKHRIPLKSSDFYRKEKHKSE